MTSFCGCFQRCQIHGLKQSSNSLDKIRERARSCISRNPEHQIYEYSDLQIFLVAFDNGAWSNRVIYETHDGNIGWVSGNPLVTDKNGISLPANESCSKVIKALEESDYSALTETCGSFSAVVWNPKQQSLRLCADKLSLRPVYVYLSDEMCFFSSSIRVLRYILPFNLDLDDEGISQFLYLGQCIANTTCFKNVEVVTPGVFLEVNPATSTKHSYYSWNDVAAESSLTFDEITKNTHNLFINATRRRCDGQSSVDAFLTGGMDSRSVVAALLDCCLAVRGFNYSYPNSADDILGRLLATKLNIDCVFYQSSPEERLKVNVDYFALKAKKYFPSISPQNKARIIWSGDGGSVGLGHVYMTEDTVELAKSSLTEQSAERLFPNLNKRLSRLVHSSLNKKLHEIVITSLNQYWNELNPKQPCRRLFLYYLLNDQMRHLHHHYEEIDISNIEFEMPFFDMKLLEFIVSLPIKQFLRHEIYKNWIKLFKAPVSNVPWQSYPGHIACPHVLPTNILSQWETNWYGGSVGNNVSKIVANTIYNDNKSPVWNYLNRNLISALKVLMVLGVNRYNYEASFARRLYEEVSGKFIFNIHK